jgi:putative AdoMet-dependent methyltransferase
VNTRFPPAEFDEWAADYDAGVTVEVGYPFDGYRAVLQTVIDLAAPRPGQSVLDLGIGTGNLAQRFAQLGCAIWGLDFSPKMLALARQKLPQAVLGEVDLRAAWPPAFQRRFDAIVSGYTFHHFLLEEKLQLVERLLDDHLAPGGRLIIADVAFNDAAAEDALRQAMGDAWEDEYFWLADETTQAMARAGISTQYAQISSCAGVFQFGRASEA